MLKSEGPPPEVIQKAMLVMQQKQQARQDWIQRYGHVRPCIHTDNWGKKIVAAGRRLLWSEKWKFIPDFLLDYVPGVFGAEWGQAELAKPEAERHPLVQWRVEAIRYMNAQRQVDGHYEAVPNGFLAAYMAFAFNLFAVEDNSRLDDLLLERLKHREQFQGARHELFAEATCLRAGFRIEREDERDPATQHAEFTAIHPVTGEQFSIEAKSKHRAGVLGRPGAPLPHEKLSLAFGALINNAIRKNPPHPLVIFMDTNLPFKSAERVYTAQSLNPMVPSRYMVRLVERIRSEHGGTDPYAMLAFTNQPHHYAAAHELDPQKHLLAVLSLANPVRRLEALQTLYQAVYLYGNIPNEFPQQ
jgi:hypothetical protein